MKSRSTPLATSRFQMNRTTSAPIVDGDEAGALVRFIVTDGLADPGGEKRADNAEHGGQDESARIVGARRQQPRDNAGDKADDDDPESLMIVVLL